MSWSRDCSHDHMTAIPLSADLPTVRLYLIAIDIRLVSVKPYY